MKGKVLVVEDQPNSRKGLCKQIKSGDFGWEVLGEASNGLEAMELVNRLQPDLVLTDIRMPLMNGLEFVERVRQKYPDILVGMFTGYKEFEYAQAALRFGALDLLLKPCSKADISRFLQKAYEHYRNKIANERKEAVSRQQQMEHTIRSLLLKLPVEAASSEQVEPIICGKSLVFLEVIDYQPKTELYTERDIHLFQSAILDIAKELLQAKEREGWIQLVEYDRFALLMSGPPSLPFLSELQEVIRHFLRLETAVKIAGTINSVYHMQSLYKFTYAAIERAGTTAVDLLDWKALSEEKIKEVESHISSVLLLGQTEQLFELLDNQMAKMNNMPVHRAKVEALTLVTALYETAKREIEHFDPDFSFGAHTQKLQSIHSAEQIVEWMLERKKEFAERFYKWQVNRQKDPVKSAIRFLQERYMQVSGLSEVAAHVYLHPNYFSQLFKKETGVSMTVYLTRIRMERGALLLANTDMKIADIAGAVGYDEPNYFTNVFRQTYHMSPSEYRKRHRAV